MMALTILVKQLEQIISKMLRFLLFISILTGVLMANSLPKYYTKTLDNGLQVVAIPMQNDSNVITTNIFYKVGSRNEIMGKSGIAHMLEHLNFKSTKNLKAGEFDEIVKGFGGVNNASTGFDYTQYYIKSSTSNASKAMELFAELMQNLALKDEEFQPERDVVAEERRWRTDNNPMGYMQFRMFNNIYLYHPYHWTPIGFMNDILNWTLEDIKNFHETYYQPKNAILVVSGDIKKEEVFELADKNFSHIENTKEIPQTVHMVEPMQDGEKNVIIHKDSQVQMISMAFHIPNYEHEDQIALSALSEMLSSGKSSILQKKLVDEKQLVNSVYGYNLELQDPGVFIFTAVCNPNVEAKNIKKEFWKIIEEIKAGKIQKEDLEKVKINTRADFIFSLEGSSSVANLYGSYLIRGNIQPLLDYEKNIMDLEVKDLVEVANKYFYKKNSTTIILKKEEE